MSTPDTDVTFLPPLADPPAIYCAGANYHDHAREMGTDPPQATFHFLVSPASLTGHRSTVHRPEGCQRLDWEVELAIVIGRPASAIHPAAAADHIAGYTVANDLSARDHVRASGLGIDWLRHKSYAGFTPLGPAIVPRRLVPDATDLELTLTVNGQVKQHSNTNQMISGVGDQVAALSRIAPLRPGDVVLTGTPAGTAAAHGHYLHPGDVVVAEITGIGRLENRIA
nr:fumarylacetoacetate hydrolase family protein [Kibdelosporangium phytohabitans]